VAPDVSVQHLVKRVRAALTFSEAATPKTLERYTLNSRGAIYGWDHIPSQTMPKRLPRRTQVEGLWLAGHWTEPGGTSFRVIYSGFQTAQLMLGHDDPGDLLGRQQQGAAQRQDASAPVADSVGPARCVVISSRPLPRAARAPSPPSR
jgi:hypothetical protein